jgi:hypothetical protein
MVMFSNLGSTAALLPLIFSALLIAAMLYLSRVLRLSRQVWEDYRIRLQPQQALALLRRQTLQIVGGRQLLYDVRLGRVILS